MKKVILAIFTLSLLGAACKKDGAGVSILPKIDWPEMCVEKELPEDFPSEYIFPNSLPMTAGSAGVSGEVRSTGEQLGSNDGWLGSFCAKASKEEVISWYDNKLAEEGFKKLGEMDGDHIFEMGSSNISVSAYDIAEGFVLYSFNIMTMSY